MALQLSVAVRNARVDAVETTIGTAPKLRLYTGPQPASCAAAASGTMLAELTLPSDFMVNASNGAKALTGTWSGVGAAAGNIGHFRLVDSAGTTCHIQGSVTLTAGGGDLELDNINIAESQELTISNFTISDANA